MFYTTTATKVVSWPHNWVPQRQNSVPRTRCEPRTASHLGDKSSAVTLVNCRREGGTHTHLLHVSPRLIHFARAIYLMNSTGRDLVLA